MVHSIWTPTHIPNHTRHYHDNTMTLQHGIHPISNLIQRVVVTLPNLTPEGPIYVYIYIYDTHKHRLYICIFGLGYPFSGHIPLPLWPMYVFVKPFDTHDFSSPRTLPPSKLWRVVPARACKAKHVRGSCRRQRQRVSFVCLFVCLLVLVFLFVLGGLWACVGDGGMGVGVANAPAPCD